MKSFRNLLLSFTEEDYREFTKRTIPCEREILGVRILTIRKLAKSIPKASRVGRRLLRKLPRGVASKIKMRAFLLRSAPGSDEPYGFSSHSS